MRERDKETLINWLTLALWAASCWGLWLVYGHVVEPLPPGWIGDLAHYAFMFLGFFWFLSAIVIKHLLWRVAESRWHSARTYYPRS